MGPFLVLLSNLDIFIMIFYCITIIFLAQYIFRSQSGHERAAEQIIGMSGQGFYGYQI